MPTQTIPKAKKDKKWKQAVMDRLEEIAMFQLAKNIAFRDYRKMYEGRLVYQDFDDTVSTVKDIAEFREEHADLPTYIKHFDIIGIITNQLSGEFDSQKDKLRVDSIDHLSRGEYFREKNTQVRKYVEDYFTLELKRLLVMKGVNPAKTDFSSEEERAQYVQFIKQEQDKLIRPDQIEENLSKDFRTVIAEWAELTLEADTIKYDLGDADLEELVDYLLTGRYFRHFHIGDDFYRPDVGRDRWIPETVFFSQDLGSLYPQDGEYVGRVHFLSGADILERYGHLLPEKTQKDIYGYRVEASHSEGVTFKESLERGFGDAHIVPYKSWYQRDLAYKMQGAFGMPMGKQYTKDEEGNQRVDLTWLDNTEKYGHINHRYAQYLRDDIDVRTDLMQVTEAYWRSYKMMGLLTMESPITEEPVQMEVEEDLLKEFLKEYKIKQLKTVSLKEARENKEVNTIAWFYVPQVWKGKKLNADNATKLSKNIYFDIEPLPFQIRGDSNLFDVKLPVAGIITSSIAQKIRPYQIEYNIVMNQIRSLLEKELGMFFMMDFNFLPTQYKNERGETTKELIEEWRESIRDVGFGFYDMSPENTQGRNPNANVVQPVDISFVPQIENKIKLAEFFQRKAYEQIGITPQRLGNPNEYESVEGTKQGVQASFAQTERIYRRFNTAKRKEREVHLSVAQYCVKDNKDIVVDYTRPDGARIVKKFTDEDFWLRKINVIPTNDAQQRKDLESFRNMMIQNNTMDSDLLDYAKLFTSDSFVSLINYARQARIRKEQQDNAQREHEQKLLDKQLESQRLATQEERDFKASENQKDRENDLREATIQAAAKIADNNGDISYIQEIKKISEDNIKQEKENRKLDLQEREVSRKETLDEKNVFLKLQELKLESEKIKAQREKSANDRYIAQINKN
ncbi:MAG: hypothetical protein KDH96_02495 [Candidatus Riesia sp.]|nr:hypothetical protein [Candidatus Riesia sp.]